MDGGFDSMKDVVIGFLGCGNVGGGVWNLLESFRKEIAHRDHLKIRVKKVLVRNVNKARGIDFPEGVRLLVFQEHKKSERI